MKSGLYSQLLDQGLNLNNDKRYTSVMLTQILEFISARNTRLESEANIVLLQHNADLINERDILLKKSRRPNFKCQCMKPDCIIQSPQYFDKWYNKRETAYYAEGLSNNQKIHTHRHTWISEINQCSIDIEPFKPTCLIIKQMVEMKFYITEVEKSNIDVFKSHNKISTAFDKETLTNLKLEEYMNKNLIEI